MTIERAVPDRDEIIALVAQHMYSGRVLNNAHRGDLVEMMVLAALGPEWRFVGLGWHPWDLQRGIGDSRARIQVKQCAALQLWGETRKQTISFGWSDAPPSYFKKYNPAEEIESEGWFCEVFIIGVHQGTDPNRVDQADPTQWGFLVIPTCDLAARTSSIVLTKALGRWPLVSWEDLPRAVNEPLKRMGCAVPST